MCIEQIICIHTLTKKNIQKDNKIYNNGVHNLISIALVYNIIIIATAYSVEILV